MSYWDKEKSLAMGEPYELHAFYLYDAEFPYYPTLRTTTAQADLGLTHTTPISDVNDLQDMNNDKSGNYYLTGNIDASATSTWNGGAGFVPIGTSGAKFLGTFDGCGYTITGLTCNRNSYAQSLFGYVGENAQIANVILSSVSITGGIYYNGALAGHVQCGDSGDVIIQNCHSSGTITSAGNMGYYGGLIGLAQRTGGDSAGKVYIYDSSSSCVLDQSNPSTLSYRGGFIGYLHNTIIKNCYATGNLTNATAGDTGQDFGGFVGRIANDANISYCYATGNVSGGTTAGETFGGFAGHIISDNVIFRCYATGDVTASEECGGFVGAFVSGVGGASSVTDCYSWGDVSGTSNVGGFAGVATDSDDSFTNCYYAGEITGNTNVGGFCGDINISMPVTSCYWDTEVSGQSTTDQNKGDGKTTNEMYTKATYVDWDFESIWQMSDLIVNEEAWFYADAPIDIEYAGQTFLAGYITGGKIEMGITGMKARTMVKTDWHNAFVWQYTTTPPSAKIMYKRFRGHGEDVQLIFRGEVLGVEFKQSSRQGNRFAEITIEPPRSKTGELGLISRYSRQCSVDLYSTQCGVTKADYQTTGTLDSYSGNVLTSTTFGGQADGYWKGGEIIIGRRRAKIIEHSGNDITILPYLYDINAGDSFSIYPGCDHLETTCNTKFSNLANYKGQPEIPIENPFGEIFGDSGGYSHGFWGRAIQ